MKTTSPPLFLALLLALFSGCTPSSGTGAARFSVSAPQALASTVSRVTVTASASDFAPMSLDLTLSGGVWGGTLGNIPAGTLRSFRAQAFDPSNTLLFEGSVSNVTITADETSLVAILLQQVSPPPPFQNEAPVIDSLVASATTVLVGGSLSLVASAHDPNTGDTLTYAWSSTGGSFSSTSAASTSWTAPTTPGLQTLTVTVTDPGGLSSSASVAILVSLGEQKGEAQLSITFNSFPSVTSMAASPTLLAVGQSTTVSASVSDLDGDSLSYAWSATCAGTWINATSRTAQFTPSALPSGACNNCRLTVAVSDGRGGSGAGTVALCVSNAPRINHFPPSIDSATASAASVSPGQVVTFEVVVNDPEGSALSFAWSTNTGTLGTPVASGSTGRTPWTAPACATAGTPTLVTVTVTNAFNLTDTLSFTVPGLPACAPGWASAAPMATSRTSHGATLLPNGRVLITGGRNSNTYFASTELYNPLSNTWSTARAMSASRYGHVATLLNNGKVLVAGGLNSSYVTTAEVYDPAANTWSAAGSISGNRAGLQAALLPNGKVLIAGGFNGTSYLATAEVYDPASNTWSATGSMASERSGFTLVPLPTGKVLAIGGFRSNTYFATTELYDPASGTWSPAAPMTVARAGIVAVLLPNGKVLVAGGYNGSGRLATSELYDPASNTWSTTGSLASVRGDYEATLLSNGKVLVTGGYDGFSYPTTAELYDPATGTWSAAGSLSPGRTDHTVTQLPNGKVLVTGGAGSSVSSNSADLFTP